MRSLRYLFLAFVAVSVLGCGNKTPEQVVENYLKAKDWQERLKYVLEPDRVKPVMEKRYGNLQYTPPEKYKVNTPKQINDQWVAVEAAISGKNAFGQPDSFPWIYYLQKTDRGYKIDWESSNGYNSISTTAFKAQRPKEPMKIRVLGTLSDNYSPVGRDVAETHWSFGLKDSDENFVAYGYISKDLEDGKKLYELLKDGETHRLILAVRYPSDYELEELKNYRSRGGIRVFSGSRDAVLIEKLVCDGWLDK